MDVKYFEIDGETIKIKDENISHLEYIEFLSKTELGKQYPKENFIDRIKTLLKNVAVSLIARNENNQIIGICFGLTDFAYWLFITDLGIDRKYLKKGLGKYLINTAVELAGGEKSIIQFTLANEDAVEFYKKIGMKETKDIFIRGDVEWTEFEVTEEYLKEIGIKE